MGKKRSKINIGDGITIPVPDKNFKNSLEFLGWQEAIFQYILDHSKINVRTGQFEAVFAFDDKKELTNRIKGRLFGQYKRYDWEKLLKEAEIYKQMHKERRRKKEKRRSKLPRWRRVLEHRVRMSIIKRAAKIREKLRNLIIYLDT